MIFNPYYLDAAANSDSIVGFTNPTQVKTNYMFADIIKIAFAEQNILSQKNTVQGNVMPGFESFLNGTAQKLNSTDSFLDAADIRSDFFGKKITAVNNETILNFINSAKTSIPNSAITIPSGQVEELFSQLLPSDGTVSKLNKKDYATVLNKLSDNLYQLTNDKNASMILAFNKSDINSAVYNMQIKPDASDSPGILDIFKTLQDNTTDQGTENIILMVTACQDSQSLELNVTENGSEIEDVKEPQFSETQFIVKIFISDNTGTNNIQAVNITPENISSQDMTLENIEGSCNSSITSEIASKGNDANGKTMNTVSAEKSTTEESPKDVFDEQLANAEVKSNLKSGGNNAAVDEVNNNNSGSEDKLESKISSLKDNANPTQTKNPSINLQVKNKFSTVKTTDVRGVENSEIEPGKKCGINSFENVTASGEMNSTDNVITKELFFDESHDVNQKIEKVIPGNVEAKIEIQSANINDIEVNKTKEYLKDSIKTSVIGNNTKANNNTGYSEAQTEHNMNRNNEPQTYSKQSSMEFADKNVNDAIQPNDNRKPDAASVKNSLLNNSDQSFHTELETAAKKHINTLREVDETASTVSLKSNNSNVSHVSSVKNIPVSYSKVEVGRLLEEVAKYIKEGNRKIINMEIEPESLGQVKLSIDSHNNTVNAKIEVESTKIMQLMNNNSEALKQEIQNSGIHLNSLQVTVNGHEEKNNANSKSKKKNNEFKDSKASVENVHDSFVPKDLGYNTYDYLI